jgi:tetratricopeptide (TPR) repeat protein
MGHAFISYSSGDESHSTEICRLLEASNISCWIAPRDIMPGRDYGEEIINAIEACSAFVLLLSEKSNHSVIVKKEVERAVSKGKPVFTVRIGEVKPSKALELFISSEQWINLFDPSYEKNITDLAGAIGCLSPANESLRQSCDYHRVHVFPRKRRWMLTLSLAGMILISGGILYRTINKSPTTHGCNPISVEPGDVKRLDTYLEKGFGYAKQRKYNQALNEFLKAQAIDKNILGLHQNIGFTYFASKDYENAEAAFKAELACIQCLHSLNDTQLRAMSYYIKVEETNSELKSNAQLEKLRDQIPMAQSETYFGLALLYSAQHKKKDALSSLQWAIQAGFKDKQMLLSDPDLAFIRSLPEFPAVIAGLK